MATVTTTELKRVFRHKGKDLTDPAPNLPAEKALELLAISNSELNNGVVEPPEAIDGQLVYNIKTSVGTKG